MPRSIIFAREYVLSAYATNHISALKLISDTKVVNVDNIEDFGAKFNSRSFLTLFQELWSIYKILRTYQPDIIISFGPKVGLMVSIISKLLGMCSIHWFTGQIWDGLGKSSIHFWSDFIISRCARFLATDSIYQQKLLSRVFNLPNNKTPYVTHPFSLNGLGNLTPKMRTENDENIRALYLGRLAAEKGLETLLSIAVEASKNKKFETMTFAGPRDKNFVNFDKWKAKIDDNVKITLQEGFQDKSKLFSDHNTFVMASDREGLPVALLEAISQGLRPICTNNNGCAEVMKYFGYEQNLSAKDDLSRFTELILSSENKEQYILQFELSKEFRSGNFIKSLSRFYQSCIA